MINKQQTVKRLGIYLLIVFAASLLLLLFVKPMEASQTAFFIVQQLYCWAPAIACIVTRAVTKEGFQGMKLHLRLQNHLRYYLLAFAVPLILEPIMVILPVVLNGHSQWLSNFTWTNIVITALQLISMSIVGNIGLLGEELGWRAYMNQKMEPLIGTFWTGLASGAIWGLWHVPNDIKNYLSGYVSFPEALQNGLERIVILIMLGIVLMWITKKTDSVFPAVILHAMHNGTIGVLENMLTLGGRPENYKPEGSEMIITNICQYLPLFMLAVIFMLLMLRDNKELKMAEKSESMIAENS